MSLKAVFKKKPAVYEKPAVKAVVKKKIIRKKALSPQAGASAEQVPQGPRMAIILDDWGNSFILTKYAIDIGRPITLSILPHLPQSQKIAEEAYTNNLGVMLHMPMQPKNQIRGLEPHTILVTMPEKDILVYLDSALESIPHVEGVNNHQGSAATSDTRVMRAVLGDLKSKGLFFIDSNTISTTVAPRVAQELGIKFTKRDVFIDNEMNPETIKNQLRRAEKIALKHGRVVVIGHDRKMTLLAIKQMVPEIEAAGVEFVLAKDLVE